MRSARRNKPRPVAESAAFWLVVVLVACVVAFLSFRVGRDWLGKRLGSVDMAPGAPRIVAHTRGDPEEAARLEQEAKAPEEPVVTLEDREPTGPERRKILEEEALREPQDGAQLHAAEEEPAPQTPPERPATEAGAEAHVADGRWVVSAGSYSDPENASRTVARLAARGHRPYTETVIIGGREMVRVNVAVTPTRAQAEALRDELLGEGITARVAPAR